MFIRSRACVVGLALAFIGCFSVSESIAGGHPNCPGAGSCFQNNGTPGCNDAACCNLICTLDPFCCDTSWDQVCADAAIVNCQNVNMACCLPDSNCIDVDEMTCQNSGGNPLGPGSNCQGNPCLMIEACCFPDGGCIEDDPAICFNSGGTPQGFGTDCLQSQCPVICGEPNAGDCFAPNGTPGCNDTDCCNIVCFADAFCCNTAWDQTCADLAFEICTGPPTEACCFSNGSCIDDDPANCFNANGMPQGPGTNCGSVNCPQPTEACCFSDGSCTEDSPANCTNAGGTPQGTGTDCGTIICPQPTEACCFSDGSCTDDEPDDCIGAGGTPQGPGTECGLVNCPVTNEACCFPDGSCLELSPSSCSQAGGVARGQGSNCESVLCEVFGACCLLDDSCIEISDFDCSQAGGLWQGADVTCQIVACGAIPPVNDGCVNSIELPIPTSQPATTDGADSDGDAPDCPLPNSAPGIWFFVYGDGSTLTASLCSATNYNSVISIFEGSCGALVCVDGNDDFCGAQSEVAWCSAIGTVYYILVHGAAGDSGEFVLSVTSDSVPCAVDPTGSCCLNTTECVDNVTFSDCFALDGTYQGDGAVCGITGACCIGSTCLVATADCCAAAGGDYFGDETTCSPDPCLNGACCEMGGACSITDSDGCSALNGVYFGDGSTCDPDTCTTGACCSGDGNCSIQSEPGCVTGGGTYQGDLTNCESANCVAGGCCLAGGGCTIVTESNCTSVGGGYQGDFTGCSPDPCVMGACCQSDGTCIDANPSGCNSAGGEYQGDGTDCASTTCSSGACCLVSNDCIVQSPAGCAQLGGNYLGDGTACSPIACEASGACCLPEGACLELTVFDCASSSGDYQGDNTICLAETCPAIIGACCLSDVTCLELSESDCVLQNGTYRGNSTSCGSETCFEPCVTRGDMDSDCLVTGLDIQGFTGCILIEEPSAGCECGDYDENGFVDDLDIPEFVDDLLTGPDGGGPANDNPKGTITVTEVPSPEPCPTEVPMLKDHKITATWTSILCGIDEIKIINLTTGQTLAEQTYVVCPTVMTLEVTAPLDPATAVIQTTVVTCGPNEGHPCCLMAVFDEVKSCPIDGATYMHIADEQGMLKEMRTLTCPGAPANSTWSRSKAGEGDLLPVAVGGATYPVTSEHDSKPVDDIGIHRSHIDPDGDCSFSNSKMTVVAIDMKIHKPKVIDTNEPAISDADELTNGVQTFVNLDNDDRDALFDTKDVIGDDTDVAGEDEMCKLRLRIKPKDIPDPCGNVKLDVFDSPPGAIKVWRFANKQAPYNLGDDIPVHGNFVPVGDWLELNLWVEGRLPSTTQQAVKLRMTYDQAPDTIKDEVAVTVLGIDSIEWIGRSNSNANNNTLDADPNWPGGLDPGALRVFPGARLVAGNPEANPRDNVDVKVTLTVDPIEDVNVFFDSFDVDDPTSALGPLDGSNAASNENQERDNRGTMPAQDGQFVMADGTTSDETGGIKQQTFTTKEATFRFRVTLQPGDNFRVVGNGDRDFLVDLRNRDQDYPTDNADKQRIVNRFVTITAQQKEIRDIANYASNRVLTVWRDVHVEVDRMGNTAGNTVTGNIRTLNTGVSTTSVSVGTTNALGDGSPDLLAANMGNGRFENGTLTVAGTTVINNLTGNGIMMIQRNAGLNITATPLPFAAAGMAGAAMNGTVTLIDNASVRLTLNPAVAPANWNAFVGGTIAIGGGTNMNINAVDAANSRVTVNALSVPYSLVDDDATTDGNQVPALDTGGIATIWATAYIRPLFDTGQNTAAAMFRLNTRFNADSNTHLNESRGSPLATARYWVVHIKQGYQTDAPQDNDARAEGTWRGVGGRFGAVGRGGAMLCEESLRDWIAAPAPNGGAGMDPDPTGAAGRQSRRREVLNHEVGHAFGLQHPDGAVTATEPNGGVMRPTCCGANIRQASTFTRRSLNIIRSRNFPG